jgi:Domain of unknown function (DUF6385)
LRKSYTAVIERGHHLRGDFVTEPYEAGWASEALFFVRLLDEPNAPGSSRDAGGVNASGSSRDAGGPPGPSAGVTLNARVQLSPDGMHWVDEGSTLPQLSGGTAFVRVREFGNWLRLAGTVTPPGHPTRAIVYLALKE